MATALYHIERKSPVRLKILDKNPDGTVDLGDEKGNLVVGKCKVNQGGRPGSCTIEETATPAKPDNKK